MYDISTINMRFYLLEIPYSHEYYRIIPYGSFYSTYTLLMSSNLPLMSALIGSHNPIGILEIIGTFTH